MGKMFFLILFLICLFSTLFLSVLAGAADMRTMRIPNSYSLYIIISFFIAYGVLSFAGIGHIFGAISAHLISAGVTFTVTFILFSLRVIGAGDSKLATACALWISVKYVPVYLFFMTLVGGVLGLVALYLKQKKPIKNPQKSSWVAQVQSGEDKVPYGVAIACGMIIAFFYAGYFSVQAWSVFLAPHVIEGGL